MQRYHATVSNTAIGAPVRDTSRSDSPLLTANFPVNQRRPPQPVSYKLKCDKEALNSRHGPPDFNPQTPNCPEETITREYLQSGYREAVEGLEENREISLTQIHAFSKPVILKCKEAIRKCHRAINESRAQKRKAGQVYGVPLSGSLLSKPGIFPDQRACGEEFRKKWIEGLSQPHKRLRLLADHIPHGFRKRSLFEVLIRNNVPLQKATWFIKVTYLNQVRPVSSSSSGVPDRTQVTRSEQWTKDLIEYLQFLLDDILRSSHSGAPVRDRSLHSAYSGKLQQKNEPVSAILDGEEPSLHFKWWYMVRIIQWHFAEGMLLPSFIIDWVLNQLQEKELLGTLQLVLPILYGVLEILVLSQTYVRTLVGLAVRFIQEPSSGGSYLVDNSRRAYAASSLVEMLRYMILAVPDSFVGLDCFPLPLSVVSHLVNDGNFLLKVDSAGKSNGGSVGSLSKDKGITAQCLSIDRVVASIKKRTDNLAMAARPGYPGRNAARTMLELDTSVTQGDLRLAFSCLFGELSDGVADEGWTAEISPCLRSSLKWMGTVSSSFVASVFFLCEWATCDFRDFRTALPRGQKFSGRKDFCQIYVAVRLLKLKLQELQNSYKFETANDPRAKGSGSSRSFKGYDSRRRKNLRSLHGRCMHLSDMLESPGELHDTIVCWIDQHDKQNEEGTKRLELLIIELTRVGIFYPQAYVRQLIVSGIYSGNGLNIDTDRQSKHYKILKQLPTAYVQDALEEAQVADSSVLLKAMKVYTNERRLVLKGLFGRHQDGQVTNGLSLKQNSNSTSRGDVHISTSDQRITIQSSFKSSSKKFGRVADLEGIKASISLLLQFPNSSPALTEVGSDLLQSSVQTTLVPDNCKVDLGEGTPGCEECRRVKRQNLSDERNSYLPGHSPNQSDDEELWWVRKGTKALESIKIDQPLKPAKQTSKGRQKFVRKKSLSQLAAGRIEGSLGASTSHVCDSRVNCSHHTTGSDGEACKAMEVVRTSNYADTISIGKALKKLRSVDKKVIIVWLLSLVKKLIEENEEVVGKAGQYSRTAMDENSSVQWKLGEDELTTILYIMDISDDLVSAVRFLLWLLPKVLSTPNSSIYGGRSILMLPRNAGNHVCDVGEAYLVSSIRRYENTVIAADLIAETLSSTMQRVAVVVSTNGKTAGSASLAYARYLLKKYSNINSVVEWEKSFKATCDKRLIPELEFGRSSDAEFGFPLGVPAGVEDLDDFFRQKISGARLSRLGMNMREIVQRHIEEALQLMFGRDKKIFAGGGTMKGPIPEKFDDGYRVAQQIVIGLMDCIRQTGGAAQEGDPSLVSSAISAIINSIGTVMGKMSDLTGVSHPNFSSSNASLNFARQLLKIHITCLCLLKEALGERQSRVFEIALAVESSSVLAQAFAPGKLSRGQYQLSPDAHDSNASEILSGSTKPVLGRAGKVSAAVSSLVLGAILQGVASLERMVSVFRLKEGLDVIQYVRGPRSSSNGGNARSNPSLKTDNIAEACVHWFRVLLGNCRAVCDGLVVELLGGPSIVALSRMQRTLPIILVFPPAYSLFAFVIWRQFIFNAGNMNREDAHQFFQSATLAISDAVNHLPFRDICMRDTRGLYDLMVADSADSEFAAILELNNPDVRSKAVAFVPLRGRLFLNSIIDCKLPKSVLTREDGNRVIRNAEDEPKILDKLVHILDTLQPAKFHWQWVELRLLLNEQALTEKLESHDASLPDAIRSIYRNSEKASVSENESNFVEIILTRLLVRPDAAPLFSEVVRLFGSSLEDSVLLQAKWFLGGQDVLFGRKSIRQRLINIAESKGLSTKAQYRKPWGWFEPRTSLVKSKGKKRKFEGSVLEEGEVVEEGIDTRMVGIGNSSHVPDVDSFNACQQLVTERSLVELVLPCIDHSSEESRTTFASDLIKQLNNIEVQINTITRGASKQSGTVISGTEGSGSKSSSRKGIRGSSPGLARRATPSADIAIPSPSALRASMSLRLQFLLRLLPIICSDRDPSVRNMRTMLVSVILRLLGSRVVHEDANHSCYPATKRELEISLEASAAYIVDLSGECLFDRLLLVLHGLLSSSFPSWLKPKPGVKLAIESGKDFSVFDRDVVETLQNDLDRMILPDRIRWRIQSAMPILDPSFRFAISCQPPFVPSTALAALQPSILVSGSFPQRNSASLGGRTSSPNLSGKNKLAPQPEQEMQEMEIDPWTLLEDGAGSGPSSGNAAAIASSDNADLKASSWLKGSVRMRRTDLTYIGAVDDDS
ncbi:mediator of RNA polymerase II transcription subunit 12 [Impatiens glandulifera]|uniref:mediator of RNA polymerase II transcription subunit 12 n=1 Tax=Impatiens glandulifera TaxID=253017 RepID=UPI001FB15349|nr:mediator of RNA polymerase II transcription subunit 12 [Impatiens glandulifera]